MFRKAERRDIPQIVQIYDAILAREAAGEGMTGWRRGVYPTEATALAALEAGDLFVGIAEDGCVAAAGRINQEQVDVYADAAWAYPAPPAQVMVLHALVVDPARAGQGWGRRFVHFYEAFAAQHGCPYLRMDTNEINRPARRLYESLGFREAGIFPCAFNGIAGVRLVCLEKKLDSEARREVRPC